MSNPIADLLIVSHVVHYYAEGRIFAYGPYAREIDVWADLFPQVRIAAPTRQQLPPADCLAFTRSNISMHPVTETGGSSFGAKLRQLASLPSLVGALCEAMRRADAIHVRCPGNLGLLGAVLAPLFSPHLVAKYAGQWSGYPGEPLTVRLQRFLLRSSWWRGPVTVYGRCPGQPAKIVPFFTSALTTEQMTRARAAVQRKRAIDLPLRVLYTGRLTASKNVDTLLNAVPTLRQRGVAISCVLLGDGPERAGLEALSAKLGIDQEVRFAGALPLPRVLDFYDWADVLVLASETEGWPKAIAEAMAFGVICVGSNRGFIPQMLGEGRGIVLAPRDISALASALGRIATEPEKFELMRKKAAQWSQHYSLDELRLALQDLLSAQWGVALDAAACTVRTRAEEAGA